MNSPNPQRERRPPRPKERSNENYYEDYPPDGYRQRPNYPRSAEQHYRWELEDQREWLEDELSANEYRPPRQPTQPSRRREAPRRRDYDPYERSYPEERRNGYREPEEDQGNDYYDSYAPRRPRARAPESSRYPPPNRAYQSESRPRVQRPVQPRSRAHDYHLEQSQREKSAYRKIGAFLYNLIFYSLTIGILLMSVMFAFSDKGDASIFGYRFYNVLTNSMAPVEGSPSGGFYSGDMVLVQMTSGKDVQAGDIVTYRVGDGSQYLTHRMIERLDELNGEKGDYLITKGDANQAPDPPVTADRVLGKVRFSIPKLGTLIAFFRENIWLSGLLIVTLFAFLVVFKAYLFSEETRKKQIQTRYSHDL